MSPSQLQYLLAIWDSHAICVNLADVLLCCGLAIIIVVHSRIVFREYKKCVH